MFGAFEASINSKFISKTIVSSDSDSILNVAQNLELEIIRRPKYLASDSVRSEPVILHVLTELKKRREEFDFVIFLQPTSPLRTSEDIDEAVQLLLKSNATALISVTCADKNPLKAFILNENGFLKGLVNNEYPFMPR